MCSRFHYTSIMLRVGWLIQWMIGFIAPYIFTIRVYRQYSTIAIQHTFQFNVTHALGFSVFTSRILTTDLSQSHCNFKSHVKSSCHSLIPFLPFLPNHLGLPSPELDPIPDYCSIFRPLCFFYFTLVLPNTSYNHLARIPRKTPSSIVKNVFTCPLPSNGCHFTVERLCCGNMFTDSLPSNGCTCHNYINGGTR
jgi:hypothetical protein